MAAELNQLLEMPVSRLQWLATHAAAPPPYDAASTRQLALARASEAAFQISVIAGVSKGFTNVGAAPAPQPAAGSRDGCMLRECFARVAQAALAAMAPFGEFAEVRGKVLMLLHRMVETLGDELVAYLHAALPRLLGAADVKELVELLMLINQLALKFHASASGCRELLASILPPLAAATFAHLAALDAAIANSSSSTLPAAGAASDDVRERRSLLRAYYSLLHTLVVHSDLSSVLTEPASSQHLSPSLRLLLSGCVEGPDMNLQRQCFVIMQRLVEQWVPSVAGFDSYVLQEALPVCFQAPAQPHFSLKDAASLPLLEASASLQKAMLAKLGSDFVVHLRDRLLPGLGCSAEFSAEYARLLCEGDTRQLRDFMRAQMSGR